MRKLLLFLALLPMMAMASYYDAEIDGIYYYLYDGKAEVTAGTYMGEGSSGVGVYSGDIVIPSSVTFNGTTYSVKYIGRSAFSGCSGLTSVTIPNSVTSIFSSAFYGCSGLTSVTIGNSVTSIDYQAFYGCSSLTSVHISDLAAWCNISFVSNPLNYAHHLYLNGTEVTDLVIPNSVTSISDLAFSGCSGLTSVTIPNSVTSIGSSAFSGCSGLTAVNIPNSVTSIGNYAFYGCTGLTSVTIGNSVTSIGDQAFYGCSGLTSVTIPNSVTSIGGSAFRNCSGLTSLTIGNSVTSIGDEAFKGCSSLTSVTIPNSVTFIGYGAFAGCSGLTSLTIGNSVTSIGDEAFKGCSSLTSVTLNNNTIVSKAYTSTSNLKDVFGSQVTEYIIGDGVTSIGDYAFYGCNGLTSVTIGNSVTSIGGSAFNNCSSLTSVHISDLAAWCNISFVSNPLNYAHHLYLNGTEVTDLVIPNSVTSIGSGAFSGCSGLTSVTIPNSVTSIGGSAFNNCSGLTSVTIPNSVTSIGGSAFNNCSGLTSVTIPNSVTVIGNYAFKNCSGLTSVTIGNSVTSIGYQAFYGCSVLTTVTINSNDIVSYNWSEYDYEDDNLNSIFGNQVKKYVVGDDVTAIGDYAFSGCNGLTSVTIPNSVTSIGSDAFSNCSSLTSVHISDLAAWCNISFGSNPLDNAHHLYLNGTEVTDLVIPNSVTSISSNAFRNCSGLTSVTIPNSVKSIGSYAFQYCSGLTSVTIPNSVKSIGSSAFYGCSGLTSVTLNSNTIVSKAYTSTSNLKNVFGIQVTEYIIGNSVSSIGNYAFYGCNGLTSVNIGNSVTSIGSSAFYGCSGLTSVNIPNSVTSIGSSAFYGCSGLTSVKVESGNTVYDSRNNCNAIIETASGRLIQGCISTVIPNDVTSIGNDAFYGCSGLTSVNIPNSVTTIGSSAFYGCNGLTSVNIGNSVTSIGDYAFYKCSGLSSVTIPNSVTFIGNYAFMYCSGLQEVFCLAASVPSTSSNAFSSASLSSAHLFVLHQSIETYRNSSPWSSFRTISTIDVQQNGFYYLFDTPKEEATVTGAANSLSGNLNIPSYVVYEGVDYDVVAIYDKAFQNCSSITSINIPNIVTTIGNKAFEGCSGLTSLSIGKKIKSIGQNAFKGCSGLNSITVASGNTVYDSRNNCNAIIETATGKLIQGCNSTVIPDDVTSIGDAAFYNCSGLTSATIPNSVTSIGDSAFNGCSGLTAVNIPQGVESIGDAAFIGCSRLTSVTLNSNSIVSADRTENDNLNGIFGSQVKEYVLGDDVTAIGQNAFRGNTKLATITIGNGVTAIGNAAFNGCTGLTSVSINSDAIVSANRTENDNLNSIFGSQVKEYVVGDDVTAIGDYAFQGNTNLSMITLGNSVTSIGASAFYNCRITSTTIPASVTAIEENAFYGCSRLNSTTISDLEAWCNISFGNQYSNPLYQTHHLYLNGTEVKALDIPTSVNAIGNYAFYGCSGLTSVNIPESVTSIGNQAFYGCSGLTSVNIPEGVTSIGNYAFYGCSGLTSVNIPESVTSIGIQAFNGCNGLTSVTINNHNIVSADRTDNDNLNSIFGSQVKEYVVGEDVTTIGQNAFRGNTNLTTVSVGKNIGSIGDNAFYGCCNLATFTCYAADIPTANSSVFEGIDLTTATLYVPASALEEYEETKPWRRFGTILPIDENAVPTAIDTAAADDYKEYFDLSGHRVTSSQRGLLIVRDRSGKTRKVMVK